MTVKNGEAIALRGDPRHPFTRGSLCNKVAGYLSYARAPERILHPMRRVGAKGSSEFTRINHPVIDHSFIDSGELRD